MKEKMRQNGSQESDLTTRQKILDAAMGEFSRLGLAGARVDVIAEQAGVNKAMIYYHYSSKKELYHEVFRSHFRKIAPLLQAQLIPGISIDEWLSGLASSYAEIFREVPEFRPLIMRELADSSGELFDQLAELLTESGLPQKLLESFSTETAAGRFREIDMRQALVSFLCMNIGYFMLEPIMNRALRIDDREEFIRERGQAVVDLFLNGLKVRTQ